MNSYNSFLYRKVLTPRRLKLDYISPPICEGEFSASGASAISLQPIYRQRGPTGLVMDWQGSYWRLRWNTYPGALCYSVYKLAEGGDYVLVAECIQDEFLNLDVFGQGTYVVTVITTDGESDPGEPIVTPSPPGPTCPEETGPACPTGADAFNATIDYTEHPTDPANYPDFDEHNPIVWDTFEFIPDILWPPSSPDSAMQLPGDYPPGSYQLRYVSGFSSFGIPEPMFCPPLEFQNWASMWEVGNDEWNIEDDFVAIIKDLRDVDNTPPPPFDPSVNIGGSGHVECAPDYATAQTELTADFHPAGFERRFRDDQPHTNDGGSMVMRWNSSGMALYSNPGGEYTLTFQLLQISGLIQQARTIQIQDWANMRDFFSDAIKDNWDGSLNTRTDYTSITCRWAEPAVLGFGGAVVYYTQAHPTAPNGSGWIMDIYEGATIVWKGYKTVGDLGTGRYYRVSGYTGGPDCLIVENKLYWDYPA